MKDSCQYTEGGDTKISQGCPSAWLLDWRANSCLL